MIINKGPDLFTKNKPKSLIGKIVQFPIVRIVIAFVFLLPFFRLNSLVADNIIKPSAEPLKTILFLLDTTISFVLLFVVFRLYTRWMENRKALELSGRMAPKEFGMGFAISFGLVGLIVLIMDVLGYYKIQSLNSYYFIVIYGFFLFGMKAFVEELIFRLIVFKLTEELLGSWIALGVVACLFGLAHLGNPGATIWSSLAIVIIGGLFYTVAYMYTRRIWFALGIHMSWNYFQAGIFGMPCSGITHDSLIQPTIEGPELITGGSFGIEMSLIAVLLCLIVAVIISRKVIIEKQTIRPVWRRK